MLYYFYYKDVLFFVCHVSSYANASDGGAYVDLLHPIAKIIDIYSKY